MDTHKSSRIINTSKPEQNGRQFCRRHCRFNFEYGFIEVCSNWQLVNIGSCNGLAPNRRPAITWINDDMVHWRISYITPQDFNGVTGRSFCIPDVQILGFWGIFQDEQNYDILDVYFGINGKSSDFFSSEFATKNAFLYLTIRRILSVFPPFPMTSSTCGFSSPDTPWRHPYVGSRHQTQDFKIQDSRVLLTANRPQARTSVFHIWYHFTNMADSWYRMFYIL